MAEQTERCPQCDEATLCGHEFHQPFNTDGDVNCTVVNWTAVKEEIAGLRSRAEALRILLEARSWGAALGAIAEDYPDLVKLVSDHDTYVKAAAEKKLEALRKLGQAEIAGMEQCTARRILAILDADQPSTDTSSEYCTCGKKFGDFKSKHHPSCRNTGKESEG